MNFLIEICVLILFFQSPNHVLSIKHYSPNHHQIDHGHPVNNRRIDYHGTNNNNNPSLSSIPNNGNSEKLQTANSNLFYIEEAGDTHSMIAPMIDYGNHQRTNVLTDNFPATFNTYHTDHHYDKLLPEKKRSKFFSEEISFVIAIVTLAVFLCFLSSVFIPLAFLFFFNGGILPFNGLNGLFPFTNTLTAGVTNPVGGVGLQSMMFGRKRRKRSTKYQLNDDDDEHLHYYLQRFLDAMKKFA